MAASQKPPVLRHSHTVSGGVCSYAGKQVSKDKATQRAAQQFPKWSPLINNALLWRRQRGDDNSGREANPQTLIFTRFLLDKILSHPSTD